MSKPKSKPEVCRVCLIPDNDRGMGHFVKNGLCDVLACILTDALADAMWDSPTLDYKKARRVLRRAKKELRR